MLSFQVRERLRAPSALAHDARDMTGRTQANHGWSDFDPQNKLAHLAFPEISCLIVVKRVSRFSQYTAAAGLNKRAENVFNARSNPLVYFVSGRIGKLITCPFETVA